MTSSRITGAIWLCMGIVSVAHGISFLDLDLWMPALLLSLFFGLAGFFGYSLLRGRLWVMWPLWVQASLVALISLVQLCLHPKDADWSLWSILVLSAWTIMFPAFATKHQHETMERTGSPPSSSDRKGA